MTADATDTTAAHVALWLVLYVLTGMHALLHMQPATDAGTTLACLVLISAGILMRKHPADLRDLAVLHGNRTLKLSLSVIVP